MPIDRNDFNKGKKIYEMAEDLRAFLGEHPNKAYAYSELVKAIGSSRPEDDLVLRILAFMRVREALDGLVSMSAIEHRVIEGEDYYIR